MYWPGASDECSQGVETNVTTETNRNTYRIVDSNRWMINLQDEESCEVTCPSDVIITSEDVIKVDQSTHCIQLLVTDQTYVITDWMLESTCG